MNCLFDVPTSPLSIPKKSILSARAWRDLRVERARRARLQAEGFESSEIFHASLVAKLRAAKISSEWFTNLERCGSEVGVTMCAGCGNVQPLVYQCSNKICPRCNWRIANRRRELLEKITAGMFGTKHVVLTQRNFKTNLREKIIESRRNLLKLRKQKIFGKVLGGCASLEITNEKHGWHPHWHMLITSSSRIEGNELAIAWGKLVGQEFAIVKVKAVTEGSYLQEICKYAVKSSELVKWDPETIAEFAEAVKKTRMFTVFGIFARIRKLAAAQIRLNRLGKSRKICECGCEERAFGHDASHARRNLERGMF